MEDKNTTKIIKMRDNNYLRQLRDVKDDILRLEVDIPSILLPMEVLSLLATVEDISRIYSKPIRLYAREIRPEVEKEFLKYLDNRDNIFFSVIEEGLYV